MGIACLVDRLVGEISAVRRLSSPSTTSGVRQWHIDPSAIGAVTEPQRYEWTERDTMLYALGVGAAP